MAEQTVAEEERLNFLHQGTYLTIARRRAIQYALSNPWGSELPSRTIWLLSLVEAHDSKAFESRKGLKDLRDFPKEESWPVLVTAHDVQTEYLLSESGANFRAVIDKVQILLKEGLSLDHIQHNANLNLSFRFNAVVAPTNMSLHQIGGTEGAPELIAL